MMLNVQTVDKCKIKLLNFPKADVLTSKKEKVNRFVKLHRAMYLNEMNSKKVRITFFDDVGLKSIDSFIKKVTNDSVLLKRSASASIPLARIVSVA